MLVEVLGWAAAIYGAFVVMPQLARVARSRTTAGISLLAWQSSWSGTLSWGAYGLMFGYPNIWIPNVLLFVSATWMLIMISKDKQLLMRDRFLIFLFPALVSLVTAALPILVGPLAFAAVVFIPAAVSQLMQLRNLAIASDISGVSMPFMAMGVIGQLLWFCWGILADDISNQVVAGCLAVLVAVNLVCYGLRRFGLVRPRVVVAAGFTDGLAPAPIALAVDDTEDTLVHTLLERSAEFLDHESQQAVDFREPLVDGAAA